MDPLVPESVDVPSSSTSSEPCLLSPTPPSSTPITTRSKAKKKKTRTGKAALQRKQEKQRIKMNAIWEAQHNQKLQAWFDSFRTDDLVELAKDVHQVSPAKLPPAYSDVTLDVTQSDTIIGITTTESIVNDLRVRPTLGKKSWELRTPKSFYSNEVTVPCLLMDKTETHSLNFYSDYEQLVQDDPFPDTAASLCKSNRDALVSFPDYGENNKIVIHLDQFTGDPMMPFSRDSLLIFLPRDIQLDIEDVYSFDDVEKPPDTYAITPTGNKICMFTSDQCEIKKWHTLRSIGFLYPQLMWRERDGSSFPPENLLFSSLLCMTKGSVGACLDFVT